METVTTKWAKALATSHTATIRCEVWDRGEKVLDSLPLIDGMVTDKWVTGTRRTLSVTVPHTPQWRELLATPMIELRPYRGINYGSGAPEVVPLGQFPVMFDADDVDPRQPLQIDADDKWQIILSDSFYGPTVSKTGLIRTEIARLIGQTALGTPTSSATSAAQMVQRIYQGSRHDAIAELCAAIGAEVFVNRQGQAILRNRKPTSAPSALIVSGDEGTMIGLRAEREWRDVYNVVSVIPTATNVSFAPVVVSITDTADPAHPARIGRRVYPWSTPLVADVGQAATAGKEMLRKLSAPQRSLAIQCIPNVALDASDCVAVIWPDGTYEAAQIDQITHPLNPHAPQQISTVTNRAEEP